MHMHMHTQNIMASPTYITAEQLEQCKQQIASQNAAMEKQMEEMRIHFSTSRMELVQANLNLQAQINQIKEAVSELSVRRARYLSISCRSAV